MRYLIFFISILKFSDYLLVETFLLYRVTFAVNSYSTILHHNKNIYGKSFKRKSSLSSEDINPNESNSAILSKNDFYEFSTIGTKKHMVWDDKKNKFKYQRDIYHHNNSNNLSGLTSRTNKMNRIIHNNFFPSGELSNDYYRYTIWRGLQRLVSATNSVFGTQALLLALGFKTNKLGLAAATTWVLKDALGKLSRIIWASKHGGKFDGDAKKWRFRASLLFAIGNTLEIVTFIVPALFLISAAMANAMKQMAMLTSSATRNTIYKSFSKNGDNIGDITAKGEAQTAVIDLLGMLLGIRISRSTNLSKYKIVAVFIVLSIVDLLCVFQEIRSVVFQLLNFERCDLVLRRLFKTETEKDATTSSSNNNNNNDRISNSKNNNTNNIIDSCNSRTTTLDNSKIAIESIDSNHLITDNIPVSIVNTTIVSTISDIQDNPPTTPNAVISPQSQYHPRSSWWHFLFKTQQYRQHINEKRHIEQQKLNSTIEESYIESITPSEISQQEKLMLPARRGESLIKCWSSLQIADRIQIQQYITLSEKYKEKAVVLLHARVLRSWLDALLIHTGLDCGSEVRLVNGIPVVLCPEILIHQDARAEDILRAFIIANRASYSFSQRSIATTINSAAAALQYQNKLVNNNNNRRNTHENESVMEEQLLHDLQLSPTDLFSLVEDASEYERRNYPHIIHHLQVAGWNTDRFMFGTIKRRVTW